MSAVIPAEDEIEADPETGDGALPRFSLPVAVVIAGLCVVVAASILAITPSLATSNVTLLVVAGALSFIAFGSAYLASQRRRANGDLNSSVSMIAENASTATLVTNFEGEKISLGGALKDADAASLTTAQAAAAGAQDAEALFFRLGGRAVRDGGAMAVFEGDDGRTEWVHALRIGEDRLIWSRALADCDDSAFASGPFPSARISAAGEILAENRAFTAMGTSQRSNIANAAQKALAAGAQCLKLPGEDDTDQIIALRNDDDAGTFLVVAPAPLADGRSTQSLFHEMPVAVAELNVDGRIEAINSAGRKLLGSAAEPGRSLGELIEGLSRPLSARIAEAAEGRSSGRPELTRGLEKIRGRDGVEREQFLQVAMTRVDLDDKVSIISVFNDATELKVLEQQFVQSQKMQAVGQLAGGVAHDFNNLLTAILGHCDLMAMRLDENAPDYEDLTQIRQNANRAAGLVRQLLAFSRQQKLNPAICSLPDVLDELTNLLNRLIGEKITLEMAAQDGLWDVFLDPQQFEQVILNLVVNAKDAMPKGGRIRITCANLVVSEEIRRDRAVVPPGDYVSIEVADDGVGMSEEVRTQVFEPFFTTKAVGEGTGLGLSTVYGIIKQTGGFIFIESEPDAGTIFRLLIPRPTTTTTVVRKPEVEKAVEDLSGAGRILLVEDETPVRTFARRALALRGYEVLEAPDADSALEIIETPGLDLDLIISDVVMPGRDGPTWVREARQSRPGISVIFTSGYSEDVFRKGIGDIENSSFLPKPFSLDELAAAVKRQITARRQKH